MMATFRRLLLVAAVSACAATSQADEPAKAQPARDQTLELQALLMNFADRHMEQVGQILRDTDNVDPDIRRHLGAVRINTVWAVQSVANEPNPHVALLDMLVLVTFQRKSSERFRSNLEPRAERVIEIQRRLEKDIWTTASRFLDEETLDSLRKLIDTKWKEQPVDNYAFATTFDEFAADRRKSVLSTVKGGSGAFGIRGATRAVDDVRIVSERAIHMAARMPTLITWYAQQVFYNMLASPEIRSLMINQEKGMAAIEKFSKIVDTLPEDFARERNATLDAVQERIGQEREAIFKALDEREGAAHGIIKEVRATVNDAETLIGNLRLTTKETGDLVQKVDGMYDQVNETIAAMDKLLVRVETVLGPAPIDVDKFTRTATEVTTAAREMHKVVTASNDLLAAEAWGEHMAALDARLDHGFWLGVQLILVLCAAAFLTGLGYRLTVRRLAG